MVCRGRPQARCGDDADLLSDSVRGNIRHPVEQWTRCHPDRHYPFIFKDLSAVRKPLVAGNWKMNGHRAMATELCAQIRDHSRHAGRADIVVCPPYTLLDAARRALEGSAVLLGAQDVDVHESGPYTGQISAGMLKDMGCDQVIVGHSERRTLHAETDQLVAEKTSGALESSLGVILCVGETGEERAAGATREVVSRQLETVIGRVGIQSFTRITIAYEPVWAIGTGLTATPDQAQEVHQAIRKQLAMLDKEVARGCRILYGGSMKPGNAAELMSRPDVDGGLIGGASLKADDFIGICRAV